MKIVRVPIIAVETSREYYVATHCFKQGCRNDGCRRVWVGVSSKPNEPNLSLLSLPPCFPSPALSPTLPPSLLSSSSLSFLPTPCLFAVCICACTCAVRAQLLLKLCAHQRNWCHILPCVIYLVTGDITIFTYICIQCIYHNRLHCQQCCNWQPLQAYVVDYVNLHVLQLIMWKL